MSLTVSIPSLYSYSLKKTTDEREYNSYQVDQFFGRYKKLLQCTLFQKRINYCNQLMRCGLAIGANISEAQQAESRSDFIHKMKIASKEASEALYWLSICEKTDTLGFQTELMNELNQIIAILSKIIISAKRNA